MNQTPFGSLYQLEVPNHNRVLSQLGSICRGGTSLNLLESLACLFPEHFFSAFLLSGRFFHKTWQVTNAWLVKQCGTLGHCQYSWRYCRNPPWMGWQACQWWDLVQRAQTISTCCYKSESLKIARSCHWNSHAQRANRNLHSLVSWRIDYFSWDKSLVHDAAWRRCDAAGLAWGTWWLNCQSKSKHKFHLGNNFFLRFASHCQLGPQM